MFVCTLGKCIGTFTIEMFFFLSVPIFMYNEYLNTKKNRMILACKYFFNIFKIKFSCVILHLNYLGECRK